MGLPEKKEEQHRAENVPTHDHNRHPGHNFQMDMHPERFPRESLTRLEEGILEDDEMRHSHDCLVTEADRVMKIEDARNVSRTYIVSGMFILIFAWVLFLFVGWDVRAGVTFFSTMTAVSIIVGLGLVGAGYVERQKVLRLRAPKLQPIEEKIGEIRREHDLRQTDHAA
ncbi:MAG TPA: hypothetical protein VFQ00_12520 [Terriglobales bacterium]|nr:hypothetical protein [Terriglobales bacterium]